MVFFRKRGFYWMNVPTFDNVSGKNKNTSAMFASERERAYKAGLCPHRPKLASFVFANQAPAIGPTMNPIENAKPTRA